MTRDDIARTAFLAVMTKERDVNVMVGVLLGFVVTIFALAADLTDGCAAWIGGAKICVTQTNDKGDTND